jgi:hypothetical protein
MIAGEVSHRLGDELPPSRAESTARFLGLWPAGAGARLAPASRGRIEGVSSSFRGHAAAASERRAGMRAAWCPAEGYGHGVHGKVRKGDEPPLGPGRFSEAGKSSELLCKARSRSERRLTD